MNKEIVLQEKRSFVAVGFTTPITTDNPDAKTIVAKFNLIADDEQRYDYPEMLLWSCDAYDEIGVWTDEDVVSRIEELLTK